MNNHTTYEAYLEAIAGGAVAEVGLSHRALSDAQCVQLAAAIAAQADHVRVIDLQNNNITNVGVMALCDALSGNGSVTEINLENNKIDAAGAARLLELLKTNPALTAIAVGSNGLSDELVRRVQFAGTMNTQPAGLKAFVERLHSGAATAASEELDVSHSGGRLSLGLLSSILAESDIVARLSLAGNGIGDAGADIIGSMIKTKKALKILEIGTNGIGLHGIRNLIDAGLRANTSIHTICLAGNKIGDDSARALIEMLRANDTLTELDLSDNAVSQNTLAAVARALELNQQPLALKHTLHSVQANDPSLTAIEFMWMPNMSLAPSFLAPHLKANTYVKVVNLSNARIGDGGAVDMAAVLRTNASITALALANNSITSDGATTLANSLASNTTLTDLNLANNDIDDSGAAAFVGVLSLNNALVALNLEVNEISDGLMTEIEGLVHVNQQPLHLKRLLPAIQDNLAELTKIDFSEYDGVRWHTDASVAVLCQALKGNSVVQHVNLSSNHIGDGGAVSLAEVLFSNASIRSVVMQQCFVGDRGAQALAAALLENQTLQELLLEGNCIGETGAAALLQMLGANHFINRLGIEGNRATPASVQDVRLACAINLQPISLKRTLPQLRTRDPALTELRFGEFDGHRAFDDVAVQILCFELRDNEHVTSIDLSNNQIGPAGCNHLAELLTSPAMRLRVLKLACNPLGDEGAVALAHSFAGAKHLVTIDLRETGISGAGVDAICQGLGHNETITSVLVSKAAIPADAAARLSRELAINMQTLTLKAALPAIEANEVSELSFCKASLDRTFDDVACRLLAMSLSRNSSVTRIDLSGNDITDSGVEFLADMLEDNSTIEALDLSDNKITDEGAEVLIKMLQANDAICALGLLGNPISAAVMAEVDYLLRINGGPLPLKRVMISVAANDPAVVDLDFSANEHTARRFDDEAVHILCSLLVENTHVRALSLRHNRVTDIGASLLADLLRVDGALERLDLSFNPVTNEGGIALFRALKSNHTLVELGREGWSLHEQVDEDLRSVLAVNATRLREPCRVRGALPIEQVDSEIQFRDPDYMHDCEDKIYDDALALDCPQDCLPRTIPGRIAA